MFIFVMKRALFTSFHVFATEQEFLFCQCYGTANIEQSGYIHIPSNGKKKINEYNRHPSKKG